MSPTFLGLIVQDSPFVSKIKLSKKVLKLISVKALHKSSISLNSNECALSILSLFNSGIGNLTGNWTKKGNASLLGNFLDF